MVVLNLSRPNHFSRFIETRSLSLIYRRQDDCPRQHECLQLIKAISVSRTAERICEARGNLEEYHIIQTRLKISPNRALNALQSPQSYSILSYLSNWGTLGGWRPMASAALPHTLSSPECILD